MQNLADPKQECCCQDTFGQKKSMNQKLLRSALCELCPIGSAKHSEQSKPCDLAVLCLLYQEVCIFARIHKKVTNMPRQIRTDRLLFSSLQSDRQLKSDGCFYRVKR